MCLALVGIGVNALLLQRERHPAPLFAPTPTQAESAAPAPLPAPVRLPVTASQEPAGQEPAAAAPPPRRAATADVPAAPPRASSDPIGDLLRGEGFVDAARPVIAAQNALAKLGYPVKADGNEGGATQQAIRDFERSHGLPLSTEITPALIKQLTQAVRTAGR
jgi:peptidoglycan hydrolase-like protein with peptidoglycan-binding domain